MPPGLHVLHTAMRAGLQITKLATLSEQRACDFGMSDQRTACAATQGIPQISKHMIKYLNLNANTLHSDIHNYSLYNK